MAQEAQLQEVTPAADMATEAESQPQDEQPTENLSGLVAEEFTQALEDAQTVGEPMADIAAAIAEGEAIMDEVEDDGEDKLSKLTIETMETAAIVQPENIFSTNKQKHHGKGKKGVIATDSADK